MVRRMSEGHAKLRLAQRTAVENFTRLKQLVREKRFSYMKRQSCTRSLCCAMVGDEEVYFVLNRQRGTIITVLTPEQAHSWIRSHEGQTPGEDQGC